MKKRKGWRNEPLRHSLASKGVKTGRKSRVKLVPRKTWKERGFIVSKNDVDVKMVESGKYAGEPLDIAIIREKKIQFRKQGEENLKREELEKKNLKTKPHLQMWEIIKINKAKGRYFFSPDTMKYFNTITDFEVYKKKGTKHVFYFVTSEKRGRIKHYDGTVTPAGKRRFTVRKFERKSGRVSTVGEFHSHNTLIQARKKASELSL